MRAGTEFVHEDEKLVIRNGGMVVPSTKHAKEMAGGFRGSCACVPVLSVLESDSQFD